MKFKAWDSKNKKFVNGDELSHLFISSNGTLTVLEGYFELYEGSTDNLIPVYSTDQTDKNGAELFKADLVKAVESIETVKYSGGTKKKITVRPMAEIGTIHEIKWNTDYAGWEPFCLYDGDCGIYNSSNCFEKIGNKYENPELLESK